MDLDLYLQLWIEAREVSFKSINPEDGGNMFLLQVCTVSQHRDHNLNTLLASFEAEM
jgi:hypothetical protein